MSLDAPFSSSLPLRPQRVFACTLCQQRKVKCDRKFPCANCVKSRSQCVPASLVPRQRKRRFPERELLDRLRHYEQLMRQNNIPFEPLHQDAAAEKTNLDAKSDHNSETHIPETEREDSVSSTAMKHEKGYEARNPWHTMNRGFRDPENDSDSSDDEVRERTIKMAWDETVQKDDNLLFGPSEITVEPSTLHPDPVQIFRLWQIYLDNVNPLLKVTHTPTLQGLIIEAIGNVKNIKHGLEALMFGIYCTAITSLEEEDCQSIFSSPKDDLLLKYKFGCRQALWNCEFLRSRDRDCLTAFYLYLISVRSSTVPQSMASMLGVAIRIAQGMGIYSESALAKCSVLEAEMRRRLWWSLTVFDHRMTELASSKISTLDPTWDCRIPLNVNDSDLRVDMKDPPPVQGISNETLFVIINSEFWDGIRHTMFHLDFTNPALKSVMKGASHEGSSEGPEMFQLELLLEDRYLKFCDEENPIHFMTLWKTRAQVAKYRLLEHSLRSSKKSETEKSDENEIATSHALYLLECDTKIMTSPLTKGFRWLNRSYFPFPAYFQIAQDLKTRPNNEESQRAWESLSDNYEAWFNFKWNERHPIFELFSKIILQAWEACEAASKESRSTLAPPRIVTAIRYTLAEFSQPERNGGAEFQNNTMDTKVDDFTTPLPMDFYSQSLSNNSGLQQTDFAAMRPDIYSDMRQAPFLAHMDQLDWTALSEMPSWPSY